MNKKDRNIEISTKSSTELAVTTVSRAPEDVATTTTMSTSRESHGPPPLWLKELVNTIKSYVLSSEDDIPIIPMSVKQNEISGSERQPMLVIVDSTCASNPSSKEFLIDYKYISKDSVLKKKVDQLIIPLDIPSTSGDYRSDVFLTQIMQSDSADEMLMIDINLQSDNELAVSDDDIESDSIVLSYLKNRDAILDNGELSETYLDAQIPSYPGSPRSLDEKDFEWVGNLSSDDFTEEEQVPEQYKTVIDKLRSDNEFLMAAEVGNTNLLQTLINHRADVNVLDHLGRNALHFAVCSGDRRCVSLLLNEGVNPNVKDSLGMTPLSLCLMRRPSWKVANMLFNHGAQYFPRCNIMDTGLFLQFVMMCTPTREDEKILELLVSKGALVNDPNAPGGRQALHFAAMSNNCRLINILIKLGADVTLTNHRNETPKQVAATYKCKKALGLFELLEETFSASSETSLL